MYFFTVSEYIIPKEQKTKVKIIEDPKHDYIDGPGRVGEFEATIEERKLERRPF